MNNDKIKAKDNVVEDLNEEFVILTDMLVEAGYTIPTTIQVVPHLRYIEWKRYKGQWGFWVEDKNGGFIAINHAPLVVRIEAALASEKIVRVIKDTWTAWVTDAAKAILTMRKVTSELEGNERDGG